MEMVSYWWSVVGFLAFVRGLLPTEAADALHRFLRSILDEYFLPYASFEIPEFEGPSINELYRNVQLHLTAKDLCRGARKTVLCKVKNSTNTTSTLAGNNNYEWFFLSSLKSNDGSTLVVLRTTFHFRCMLGASPSLSLMEFFGEHYEVLIQFRGLQQKNLESQTVMSSVIVSLKLGSDREHFILVKSIALALLNIQRSRIQNPCTVLETFKDIGIWSSWSLEHSTVAELLMCCDVRIHYRRGKCGRNLQWIQNLVDAYSPRAQVERWQQPRPPNVHIEDAQTRPWQRDACIPWQHSWERPRISAAKQVGYLLSPNHQSLLGC